MDTIIAIQQPWREFANYLVTASADGKATLNARAVLDKWFAVQAQNLLMLDRMVEERNDLIVALEGMVSASDGIYHGIADIGRAALAKARA